MQNEYDNFDLEIKSLLEDAEAKPSRHVWKGVSSRLDAASEAEHAGVPVWFRWAGASLAVAAALGAGLFFTRTAGSDADPIHLVGDRREILADNVSPQVLTAAVPSARSIAALSRESSPVKSEVDDDTPVRPAETEDAARSADDNIEAGQGDTRSSFRTQRPDRRRYRSWDNAVATEGETLDLLAMEESTARKAGRWAAYAKGAVGGNDADMRLSSAHPAMAPGSGSEGISELSTSTYGIPFSLGVGFRYYFLPRLSIGSGVDYSLLTRTFTGRYTDMESMASESGSVLHSVQYLGIPIGLYYDVIGTDKVKLYTYALGEVEWCIANNYTLYSSPDIRCSDPVKSPQYSIGGGLGIEFALSRRVGLYVDPGVRYYFPCDQPKSIRTDKPMMINLDAGLRFNF